MATVTALLALGRSTAFPPGWNGVAQLPPMGWRSWNAFGAGVSQAVMERAVDALFATNWTVDGRSNVSLASVGYSMAGVDEGWEACGKGVNGTQHDAQGNPVINPKFPDMGGLVEYSHARGIKMGWYENGCACGERHALDINYQGDVRQLNKLGFDGVKLDGCGAQRNMTRYAELMNATGRTFLIENCHWGRCTSSDDSSCPDTTWCPFNWYRSSGDINSSPYSWLSNLQTTIRFQTPSPPLSRPGCWAYPDMLEVGRLRSPATTTAEAPLQVGESRTMSLSSADLAWNAAHFGAWVVTSSPLILGLEMTAANLAPIIPIITNPEALAVSQTWAGHPGTLVWSRLADGLSFPHANACDPTDPKQTGWRITPRADAATAAATTKEHNLPVGSAAPSSSSSSSSSSSGTVAVVAPSGHCLSAPLAPPGGGRAGVKLSPCSVWDPTQAFEYTATTGRLSNAGGGCLDVHNDGPLVWLFACSASPGANDFIELGSHGELCFRGCGSSRSRCMSEEDTDPSGQGHEATLQAWAKDLGVSAGSHEAAVLLINPTANATTFQVPLSDLPLGAASTASADAPRGLLLRDIWERADLPPLTAGTANLTVSVSGYASRFLKLSR